MRKTEIPCTCSKSQPGLRGQFKEPSVAFVTYCDISCCDLGPDSVDPI